MIIIQLQKKCKGKFNEKGDTLACQCFWKMSPFSPFFIFQPNAISKIIITTNPKVKPATPKNDLFPLWISGINSSTTTYIIAPAAKDNKYGNIGTIILIINKVRTAAIGSTIPDKTPYVKSF